MNVINNVFYYGDGSRRDSQGRHSSWAGFGAYGSFESPSGQSQGSWKVTTAVYTPKLAWTENESYTDYILSHNFKTQTAPNSGKKESIPNDKESAHMSFGDPNNLKYEVYTDCKTKTTDILDSQKSRKSSFHKNAVPGVLSSLNEIELEFDEEILEESPPLKENNQMDKKIHNSSSDRISVSYELVHQDNSYIREDNCLKAAWKPIKWLAEVTHFWENGAKSRLHEASNYRLKL